MIKIIKDILVFSIKKVSSWVGGVLVFNDVNRLEFMEILEDVKSEVDMLLSDNESFQIYSLVKASSKIKGDLAEVGVYNGGSAKIICEAKGERTFYAFDTFEGLPDVAAADDKKFFTKEFKADYKDVKRLLSKYKKCNIIKGLFPDSSKPIKDKRFSFVHLDVDLYKSTLDSLKFFYPRLNKGGVLISHDSNSVGVMRAFTEFFKSKPEIVIELVGSQILFIKQ